MKLPTLKFTRSSTYTPENYLSFCEEEKIEPTLEGFKEFVEEDVWYDFEMALNADSQIVEEISQ